MKKSLKFWNSQSLKIALYGLMFFLCFSTHAQTNSVKEITGRVIDQRTKEPLALASVRLSDDQGATVTNKDGRFSIKIPVDNPGQELLISFMGYESARLAINTQPDPLLISLIPSTTILKEVTVSVPQDPGVLVLEMLKNRQQQGTQQKSQVITFFREAVRKKSKNLSLAEAIIEVDKQPNSSDKNDVARLIQFRKSTNYKPNDTLAVKLQGGPYNTLFIDIAKYPDIVFDPQALQAYRFTHAGFTQIDQKLVHIVHFEQKQNVITPLYRGELYITTQGNHLAKAIFEMNVTNREAAASLFVRKKPARVKLWPTSVNYQVDYSPQGESWTFQYSKMEMNFTANWKNKLFNTQYQIWAEMAVTDQKNPSSTNTMDNTDVIKPSVVLSESTKGFGNPDFWGEYTVIEPDQSIEEAIERIIRQLNRWERKTPQNE
ncbi:MAG TPA: hypothetical protein DEQ44_04235 [Flavobacteriaceae bacterium]|jgi:hypothetical protein|nr:hypothetical protein [Flavobacteriaceae bacterium]